MSTDLFGGPLAGYPKYELSLWQKRQATLLYHWMSLDYLRGLKDLIDALIKGADVNLELAKRQGRDALLTSERWGVRDTAANWSTFVFPALEDFRRSTIKDIAMRSTESFEFTGANDCGHMIGEFSSLWMTEEEEQQFKEQWEQVYRYAAFIDYAAGAGGARTHLDDYTMHLHWVKYSSLFPRLPRLRVRTDVAGETGKRPMRTGVFIAQDDPHATPQFAWTGNDDGILGQAQAFNDVGLRMLSAVGRDSLWLDSQRTAAFVRAEALRNPSIDMGPFSLSDVQADPSCAGNAMAFAAFATRACKWYYVERVEGEFDDEAESSPGDSAAAPTRLRCEAGQPCPREGYWFTPARPNSRRAFRQGEVMPDAGGSYGATIWQWDEVQ